MSKILPYNESPIEISSNKPQRFKDELNFAEFPLGSLADSVATETKSLIFTDTIFDQGTNQPVTRKLTISPSSEYGLPRALDEEVILGLIQLSNRDGFNDRKVHFSSYELIKLLGWSDSTKSYKRIEEALKRWVGVTLYYDKAWWSKEERSWVSEHFHVIESVTTYDRERKAQRKKLKLEDPNAARSYFVWSDQVFQSFRAGNLKEIDLGVYRELESSIAKRLYRFLDKRFYHKANLEFELLNFAYEKIGIARTNKPSEVKRLLLKPILELEAIGFIAVREKEERFTKIKKGHWKIFFEKGALEARGLLSKEQDVALNALKGRGITGSKSSRLVRDYDLQKIAEKIAMHDWLLGKNDKRCSENPSGFLVAAIQNDYPIPADFLRSREEAKANLRVVSKPAKARQETPTKIKENKEEAELKAAFALFWDTLDEVVKEDFEARALATANSFLKKQYLDGKESGGQLYVAAREMILISFFKDEAFKSAGNE